MRRDLEQFMYGFPSNMAPIVGQQVTLSAATAAVAGPRLDLLEWAASHSQCDLVAKAQIGGKEHGALFTAGVYVTDQALAPPVPSATLRQQAISAGGMTFTCVPPGSGTRIGIDRDLDGILDGDE
jgi:hypothetical protein